MESGFQLAQRQAEAYEVRSGVFMRPSARLIVESIGLLAGDVVLDLACGTGLVARFARPTVDPGGRVVGADVNPAMLAVAASLSGPGIDWTEAPAHNMPFDDATFTHVVCQQGFQFFSDPLAAALEAKRVLRPGGALVATIWAVPDRNPYIETQLSLLAELDGAVAASARAAIPAAADELLRELAAEAGFRDIDMSLLEHSVDVKDVSAFFLDQTASTPWASVLDKLSLSEQNRLADEFADRLDADEASNGCRLAFCSHMLVCHK